MKGGAYRDGQYLSQLNSREGPGTSDVRQRPIGGAIVPRGMDNSMRTNPVFLVHGGKGIHSATNE